MEIHIGGTMYGVLYIGYKVRRLKYRVQCMESHTNVKIYGESFRGYNVWRIIQSVQCMETHIEGTMSRD